MRNIPPPKQNIKIVKTKKHNGLHYSGINNLILSIIFPWEENIRETCSIRKNFGLGRTYLGYVLSFYLGHTASFIANDSQGRRIFA